jgi:hypothetical protein
MLLPLLNRALRLGIFLGERICNNSDIEVNHTISLHLQMVCDKTKSDVSPGAHTERRGVARPVRTTLGGENSPANFSLVSRNGVPEPKKRGLVRRLSPAFVVCPLSQLGELGIEFLPGLRKGSCSLVAVADGYGL